MRGEIGKYGGRGRGRERGDRGVTRGRNYSFLIPHRQWTGTMQRRISRQSVVSTSMPNARPRSWRMSLEG